MKLPVGVSVLSLLLLLITVDTHALSVSRPRTTNVTIVEITTKLEAQLGENPENVDALLALAKLHCFAYAYNRTLFSVADSPQEPDLVQIRERSPYPYRWSSHVLTVTGGRITHLAQAIPLLQKAAELDPERYETHLGLGYAYMEAAERWGAGDWLPDRVAVDEAALKRLGAKTYWEDRALASLSTARSLFVPKESEFEMSGVDLSAVYTLFILSGRESLTPEEEATLGTAREEALKYAGRNQLTLWVKGRPVPRTDRIAPPEAMQRMEVLYPYVSPEANGAEYYVAALAVQFHLELPYDAPVPFQGEYKWGIPAEPFSEETQGLIDQVLAANAESLRLLHEGARFTQHRYPVDFSMGMGMDLGHLAPVRQLARLAAMQAVLTAERQQSTAATEALLDGVALARSLDSEPTLISALVRVACAGIIIDAAQQVLNRTTLSDSDLARLQKAFSTLENPKAMIAAYEGEKWTMALPMPPIETLFPNASSPNSDEQNPSIPLGRPMEISDEERKAIEERQREQFQTMQTERLADINTCLEKLRLPVYETYQFVKLPEDFDINNPAESLGDRRPSPMQRAITAYIRHTATVRAARAALAVERFRVRNQGNLPDSLEVLVPSYLPRDSAVDPFTNETLLYQIGEDRIVVYSVGDPMINDKVQRDNPEALSGISFSVVY